jgi:hypothetical protein
MVTPAQKADAARAYCKRGMFIVPAHHPVVQRDGTLRCSCGNLHKPGKMGKEPCVAWTQFQTRKPREDQIGRWWSRFCNANIACIHGAPSGTCLLDFDGLLGYATLRALELELGPLPATPTVLTPGNGSHMYFKHPGVFVPTNKNVRECMDVRGDGGISILPPSQHEYGEYEWECDLSPDDVGFADLPQAWIDLIVQYVGDYKFTDPANLSTKQSADLQNVQWQAAPDGTILVTDGREQFMRDQVWGTLLKMMQQTGVVPSADELLMQAVQAYMPYVDLSKPGRGLEELRIKCIAAVNKMNRVGASPPMRRGLTKPFLIRS